MNDYVPSIKVTLYMTANEFDFKEVTHRLGVTPTTTKRRDSFPPKSITAGTAKTIWALAVEERNCIAVAILFERMIELLRGKEALICEICNDYGLETRFEVVVHMQGEDAPEMVLHREVVSFAAAINADIGFDLYYYE